MAKLNKEFPPLFKSTVKGGVQIWMIAVEPGKLADGKPSDTGVIVRKYGLQDGAIREEREEVTRGKNYGKSNATTPYQQALNDAQSEWEIKLKRKGYGLNVADSKATRAVSAMLAEKYKDHVKKVEWGSAFAQPKLDGFRCLARIGKGGKMVALSRENQPLSALTHITEVLDECVHRMMQRANVGDVILDGEAYVMGMPLNTISKACKKKTDLSLKIQYHIYDALLPDGGRAFKARAEFVKDLISEADNDCIVGVKTVKVRNESELMLCQGEFIAEGYEGAMLRHSSAPYQPGQRSTSLLKVKTFQDGEYKVVDYKLVRDNKYAGAAIFVCETEDGNSFDVLAPGTVPEKKAMGANAAQYVGKMLTVKYAYMTATDEPVPFQPVGMRFREE